MMKQPSLLLLVGVMTVFGLSAAQAQTTRGGGTVRGTETTPPASAVTGESVSPPAGTSLVVESTTSAAPTTNTLSRTLITTTSTARARPTISR